MSARRARRVARRECEILGAIASEADGASIDVISEKLGRDRDDVYGHLVWIEHHGQVISELVGQGESSYRVYWLPGWKR